MCVSECRVQYSQTFEMRNISESAVFDRRDVVVREVAAEQRVTFSALAWQRRMAAFLRSLTTHWTWVRC